MFVLSFKTGNDDPTRDSFDKYYISLVEMKYFSTLIDNKPFFDQSTKDKQEAYEKLVIQEEIYHIIYIFKKIINLLVLIYQGKQIQVFLKKLTL